jgi:hypothetical protein
MNSIYRKLYEAVERSGAPCYDCEQAGTTHLCGSPYVDQQSLLVELKKLEVDEQNEKADSEVCQPIVEPSASLPPMTQEEIDHYEGLRPKETLAHMLTVVGIRWEEAQEASDGGKHAIAQKKWRDAQEYAEGWTKQEIAEARKKALLEVRDEVESLEKSGKGELGQWRTFKILLVNKLDEMICPDKSN